MLIIIQANHRALMLNALAVCAVFVFVGAVYAIGNSGERALFRAVVHAICFPCRRVLGGWIKAEMKTPINVHPTHWRDWAKDSYKAGFKPMDAVPTQ
jgi:hypothetical protein